MKHEIIQTENYLLVVDDSEIKEGNWYFDSTDKAALNPIYKRSQDLIEEYYGCKKIIAHLPLNNSPMLEFVPLLPPLEEDEDISNLTFQAYKEQEKWTWGEFKDIFPAGYNKAKEKYKYTEEQLKTAIHKAIIFSEENRKITSGEYAVKFYKFYGELIQSPQQPKYPVAFECEMELYDEGGFSPERKPKTITNSQGQTVLVGTYKYE